jgi:hypothetical protein
LNNNQPVESDPDFTSEEKDPGLLLARQEDRGKKQIFVTVPVIPAGASIEAPALYFSARLPLIP